MMVGPSLAIVVSLVQVATLEIDLGVRADASSTTLAAEGRPDDQQMLLSAVPSASLLGTAGRLGLRARYAPRIWTRDLAERREPLVMHSASLRFEVTPDAPWRAEATATGIRGTTDLLSGPVPAIAAAGGQAGTTRPFPYEELRVGAAGEVPVDGRTTVTAAGGWYLSRAVELQDRDVLPPQRAVSLESSITRLATELDTLRLDARTTRIVTTTPVEDRRSTTSTATATWRRRLSTFYEAWLSGGATLVSSDQATNERRELLPAGEVGVQRGGEVLDLTMDLVARATTLIDRFTGDPVPMASAAFRLEWHVTQGVALAATTSAGSRIDGETKLAAADARLIWELRERLSLEVGVLGRWQRERRPEVPSFAAGALFTAVTYGLGLPFRFGG